MQTEIEAKFLDVNHDEIRDRLKMLGAKMEQPMRLMRRKNFDVANTDSELAKHRWVRVRDEGDKVTLAYKQMDDRGVHGTKEVSAEVNDFDAVCTILENAGLTPKSYQETKRESWTLGNAQIELDEWPWAKPYIEIEAPSEGELFEAADKLGFDRENALHGPVEVVYTAEYEVTDADIDGWQEILFAPVPEWLEEKRRA